MVYRETIWSRKERKRKTMCGMSIATSDNSIYRIVKSNLMDIEQYYGTRKK
jgi:hypothetical protein